MTYCALPGIFLAVSHQIYEIPGRVTYVHTVLTCSEETTVNVVNVVGGVGDYAFFPSCQFIILFYVIETILIRYTHLYKQLGNKTPMN